MRNVKKISLCIFINFLLFLLGFALVEFVSYIELFNKYRNVLHNFAQATGNPDDARLKYILLKNADPDSYALKPFYIKKNSKPPIVIFGCSYAFGFGLDDDENFAAKLSDYTNTSVYNFAYPGMGLPYIYWLLQNNKLPDDNTREFIYVCIYHHTSRMTTFRPFIFSDNISPRYKLQNGKFREYKMNFPLLSSLFSSILFREFIEEKIKNYSDYDTELYLKMLKEINSEIYTKYPGSKFTVLFYNDAYYFKNKAKADELILSIQNLGIPVISVNELTDSNLLERKYTLSDFTHPSALAWDEIVPPLAKKMHL